MAKPHLAVVVGSNRRDSINRKLALALAKLGADKFDANFVRIDHLPMFNQDLEGSLPPEVVRYKNELAQADGILIVTPEHDRSIPAVLKNAIDWGARPYGQNSWAGKPAFITGTSPGAIGSAIAQQHLRSVMVSLGVILHRRRSLRDVQAELDRRAWQYRRREHAEIPARLRRSLRHAGRAPGAGGKALCGGVGKLVRHLR